MQSLKPLVKVIGASSAAIMVPNLAERYLYCYRSYNMPDEWINIKNSFDNYTSQGNVYAYKTGKSIIANGLKYKLRGYYIESVMIVPINNGTNIIGTLELIHNVKDKAFSDSDLQIAIEFTKKLKVMKSM